MNEMLILVGPPQCGKTRLLRHLVATRWLAREWVFVHDRNGEFTRGPLASSFRRYRTADEWRAAAAAAARTKTPLPRGASMDCGASEVTKLVVELGDRHNNVESVRFPMRLVFDEGSMLEASGATWAGKSDVELIARRRHLGIAPVFAVQEPMMLPPQFYVMCTDVYLWEGLTPRGLDHVAARCAFERRRRELDVLAGERGHGVVHCKPGEGPVPEL
jgi:hypothetical protein